jgi:hypothetical protein
MKNNLKKLISLDFKTLMIMSLIIIILLLKMCTPKPEPKPGSTIKVNGKNYVVIKRIIDTQYIPKTQIVYKPGETIFVETPIYVDVPANVDTAAILKDYYAKRVYKDTIKLKDSLGTITLIDTLQENKIKGRWFKSDINQIVIKDSIIVEKPAVNQLYVGGTIGADKVVGFNYFGPTFVYKTKSDNMYSLGVGINNNKTTSIQGGVYWKIKLKKK